MRTTCRKALWGSKRQQGGGGEAHHSTRTISHPRCSTFTKKLRWSKTPEKNKRTNYNNADYSENATQRAERYRTSITEDEQTHPSNRGAHAHPKEWVFFPLQYPSGFTNPTKLFFVARRMNLNVLCHPLCGYLGQVFASLLLLLVNVEHQR